jgi:glutamine amidotransferase
MNDRTGGTIAIVDCEMGNLFSVQRACERVGMQASITHSKSEILTADGVLLPGVGAFGDAMRNLERHDLVSPLRDIGQSGRPLIGICLGMQLLMTESEEFGSHGGLDLIRGTVRRLDSSDSSGAPLKVPHVGWNRVQPADGSGGDWRQTALAEIPRGAFMYFVHSYYVSPEDQSLVLSTTSYGNREFCSSLQRNNLFACQFHPERSGEQGISIYESIRTSIANAIARESVDGSNERAIATRE